MDELLEISYPEFLTLVVSLSIIVAFLAEQLVGWAAGGLDPAIALGLSAAVGLTVALKAVAWRDRHVPPKSS